MSRARVAIAAAIATSCALVAAACSLDSKYTDGVDDSSGDLDASVPADATATTDASTPDPVPIVDAGTVDSTLGPGPWGDYCYGVPVILEPTADETVGLTFEVSVQAPACITAMLVYMNGAKDAIAPVIGPLDGAIYTLTVTVPARDAGAYFVNANGWDNTNDAHASDHVHFGVSAGH